MGLEPETSYSNSFREGSGSLGLTLPWIPKLKMYETCMRMGSLHKLLIFLTVECFFQICISYVSVGFHWYRKVMVHGGVFFVVGLMGTYGNQK